MPDDAVVREHLNQILASAGFQTSERLSRFLRFAVEAKLRGEHGHIKEYLIGREVFDRGDEYDPRLDPIVRVEARRLRKKLDEYYAAVPGDLRIEFPKGSYAPEFHQALPAAAAPARRNTTVYLLVLAAFATAVLLISLSRARPNAPLIAVVPAGWFWQTSEFSGVGYDVDLAELTAAELASRRPGAVTAWPLLQKYKDGRHNIREIQAETHAARTLMIAVRPEDGQYRVTAYLMDAASGGKVGAYDTSAKPLATLEQRRQVAKEIAGSVAAMQ